MGKTGLHRLPLFALILSSSSAEDLQSTPSDTGVPAANELITTPADQQEVIRYADVEVKPKFNGGDVNDFTKWVFSHLEYPQEARKAKITGRVTVQFTINTDGGLSDITVLAGPHETLNNAAVSAISQAPSSWTPGYEDGKPVAVSYVMPILFQLRNE